MHTLKVGERPFYDYKSLQKIAKEEFNFPMPDPWKVVVVGD